ncbi:hypothetical protein JCGZ_15791 [Jatropha curcas]|uniref:Uncharacterized protein n=1 Tax=Jatropha curcas TaxID=180498 RepID=A0A067LB91_JATCU|nr:nodulin-26 [Jatropha curcas]KDP41384.1 hypothetical protein JCGZ_15791 [Jatropha curcas]
MASHSITSTDISPKLQLPVKRPVLQVPEDNPNSTPSSFLLFQKILAEFLGTYVLIFIGCGSALTNDIQKLTILGIAIVWGVVLMALIYAVGHISGAHFNPAVSIALAAVRKFSWKHVPVFVLAQVLGSTLAILTLKVLFHDQDDIQATMTQYKNSTSHLEAIIWEFIITFILMFNICAVATDHRASKDFSGVAIGGTLLVNVMVAGPITGASMNPARSLGPAIVSGVYKNLWVFLLSPVLGALAATMVYNMLRVPKPDNPEEKTKNIFNHLYTHADP